MTIEETKEWLEAIEEKYIHGGDDSYDKKRKEAINTAIRSLEAWKKVEEEIDTYLWTEGFGSAYRNEIRNTINNALTEVRTMKKAIQPNEYEKWGKLESGTSEEEVIKAVNVIKEYCKTFPNDCYGCAFSKTEEVLKGRVTFGCILSNPNHLPETWDIGEVEK